MTDVEKNSMYITGDRAMQIDLRTPCHLEMSTEDDVTQRISHVDLIRSGESAWYFVDVDKPTRIYVKVPDGND